MRGLLLAALVEASLITWRDLSKQKVMPLPSDYVAVAILYGGLGLLPAQASGAASLIGWGIVVATFLNLPGSQLVYPGTNAQTGGGLGGGAASSNTTIAQPGGGLTGTQGPLGPQYGTPSGPVKAA